MLRLPLMIPQMDPSEDMPACLWTEFIYWASPDPWKVLDTLDWTVEALDARLMGEEYDCEKDEHSILFDEDEKGARSALRALFTRCPLPFVGPQELLDTMYHTGHLAARLSVRPSPIRTNEDDYSRTAWDKDTFVCIPMRTLIHDATLYCFRSWSADHMIDILTEGEVQVPGDSLYDRISSLHLVAAMLFLMTCWALLQQEAESQVD